jgi:hypothetical protein
VCCDGDDDGDDDYDGLLCLVGSRHWQIGGIDKYSGTAGELRSLYVNITHLSVCIAGLMIACSWWLHFAQAWLLPLECF